MDDVKKRVNTNSSKVLVKVPSVVLEDQSFQRDIKPLMVLYSNLKSKYPKMEIETIEVRW